ncbi:MAG: FliH/SctL family protein [Rubrivivax sp.]
MTASSKPPPAKAPGTYSRFIPREELGSFSAWDPGSLNGELGDGPGEQQAATTEAPTTQALAAAARQAGYQDGYRDGLAALDSFKQSFAKQMAGQVGLLVGNFNAELEALEVQMAQAVATAAVMLARRVVRSELLAHPEQVAQAAQQAVNAVLLSAGHIKITVNPADLAFVADGAAEALQARGARLLGDAGIERGGVLVESDLGRIDARIETRWQQAAAVLGSELPWSDPIDSESAP